MADEKIIDLDLSLGLPPDYYIFIGAPTNGKLYKATVQQMKDYVNGASPQPPQAQAGADQQITLPIDQITVNANGSTVLPPKTIVAYQWAKISGPAAGTITNPNQAQTTITGLVGGAYIFQVTVTDSAGEVDSDTLTVVVNGSGAPPPSTSSEEAIEILTGQAQGINTVTGDPVGYSISSDRLVLTISSLQNKKIIGFTMEGSRVPLSPRMGGVSVAFSSVGGSFTITNGLFSDDVYLTINFK